MKITRYIFTGLVLLSGCLASLPVNAQISLVEMDNPLDDALWNNRLLAVCVEAGASIETPIMQVQYDSADWAEYLDRDLILVWVAQDELFSWIVIPQPSKRLTVAATLTSEDKTNLRQRIKCTGEAEFVALVGKDGDLKRTWQGVAPNDEVFAAIDAMPMRRSEVRERGEK